MRDPQYNNAVTLIYLFVGSQDARSKHKSHDKTRSMHQAGLIDRQKKKKKKKKSRTFTIKNTIKGSI